MPFARPRQPGLTEETEFNRLCGYLRTVIEHGHA
jgi:hypothetical protein